MQGINFRGITITVTVIVVALCLVSLAGAEEKEENTQEDYRIEVRMDTIETTPCLRVQEKEIRFISPNGKTIKTLPYGTWQERRYITVSPNGKYLVKTEDTPAEWKKDSLGQPIKMSEAKVRFSYVDAKGKTKWNKEIEIIYPLEQADEDDAIPYFFMVSKNGDRIVFVKGLDGGFTRPDLGSNLIVFDALGREVASILNVPFIESRAYLGLAPDGKIVGAEVYPAGNLRKWGGKRHFLFLNIETGRTKIVKAEGEVNGRKWSASFSLRKDEKIYLYGGWHDKVAQSAMTSFDELPDDLSVLFQQRGE